MIFYVGGPAQDMADGNFQNIHFKSVFLVALFVLSLWSPALSVETPADDLQSQPIIAQSAPYALESGYGHDLASTAIDEDGLVQVNVREESMFDMWITTAFNTSTNEHHGTPDMKLTRHDKQHYCWSTE